MKPKISKCKRCGEAMLKDDLILGYCPNCTREMTKQDIKEPDGGAYREHQGS